MLGSCFAQYMGQKMAEDGFDVMVNPLGTLFNPFSIDATVRAALCADAQAFPLFETDEMGQHQWRCWWANTRWKAETRTELQQMLSDAYGSLGASLRAAQHLVVTLGTNVCYRLADGLVVTNCQRQPDRLFHEWRASLEEVTQCLMAMTELLLEVNPKLQLLFTVSPYRYHKYGYHQSQLSKAVLLLAEDAVIRHFPESCSYFPAYEILLDELRDYTWYAPDKHHPAPAAIDIIYDKFRETCIQFQP